MQSRNIEKHMISVNGHSSALPLFPSAPLINSVSNIFFSELLVNAFWQCFQTFKQILNINRWHYISETSYIVNKMNSSHLS